MISPLSLSILKDNWMVAPGSMDQYLHVARQILAGETISTGFFSSLKLPDVPKNISLITMAGVLTKADICGGAGTATLTRMIEASASDKSIEAIFILSENCPGGQVDGTETLAGAIAMARTKKPVYGIVSGMVCSAGYWALSQCDKIYATSTTDMIGCVGTVARMKNPKATADEEFVEVYSDLSPDKGGEFRDAQTFRDHILNPMSEAFHKGVTSGRGDRLKMDKENVLSGKIYLVPAAKKWGLIDGIASFNNIIGMAQADIKKQKMSMKAAATFTAIFAAITAANVGVQDFQPLVKGVATETEEEGYLVPEAAMEALEVHTANASLVHATALAALNTELVTTNLAARTAATDLANANAALTIAQARITELEAQDGTAPTSGARDKDDIPNGKPDAITDPNSSLNRAADAYGV